MKPEDCPFCSNVGFTVDGSRHPIYEYRDDGSYELVGWNEEAVQVQCEFCWTNPNSKFNAEKADAWDPDNDYEDED